MAVDLDLDVPALAETAATTLVRVLATEGWNHVANGIASLWRRKYPDRQESVKADLADARSELVTVSPDISQEAMQSQLTHEWASRLRRLIAADPDAATDLIALLTQMRQISGDQEESSITMSSITATASGRSRVNQAGRDLNVNGRDC